MNKKMTTLMLGIATVLLASCSQNEDVLQTGTDGTLQAVTITATTGGSITTRSANAQGDNEVTRCLIQIFEKTDAEGQELQPMEGYETPKLMTGSETGEFNTTATLNPTKEYSILFWADEGENAYTYDGTEGLQSVTVAENAAPGIAYAGSAEWSSTNGTTVGVKLKHAVTKVTVQSTTIVPADKRLSLTVPKSYVEYNVSAGKVSGSATSKTYEYTVPIKIAASGNVFSCYALVDDETQDLILSANEEDIAIANVPLAPNKHTILKGDVGNLGLETVTFTCTIDENWGSEDTLILIPDDAVNITPDNCSISGDDNYVVSGTFNNTITITDGSPTIYLDADITASSGCGISITGGNPTIHVVGENNSVSSADNTGIYVAENSTVTIQGTSRSDVLTVKGAKGGSGIGGFINDEQQFQYANCGSIKIQNITVYAYGNSSNLGNVSPGIGSVGGATCQSIDITNAVVHAYGGGAGSQSAPSIGNGFPYVGSSASKTPSVTINDSEVHAHRGVNILNGSSFADYIGRAGTLDNAYQGITLGDDGSCTNSTIYCYTGANTLDKTVKYDASGEGKEQ